MIFNPLRTLWGRLVLVTIAAIAISHVVAFTLFASERARTFRREAENRIIERIVDATQEVRAATTPQTQAERARAFSNRGMRFYLVGESAPGDALGSGAAIARAVAAQIEAAEVRGRTRTIQLRWRPRMRDLSGRDDPPPDEPRSRPVTQITVDVRLGPAQWLRSTALLPAPRPVPDYLWIGALASMIAVGVGAALIAQQIGRPLSDLATAARRLGMGETKVYAPVSGPQDVRRASTAFNSMAERLGRQIDRQRQMLWALSHDLRTPITALRLRAELIEDEALRQRLLAPLAEMELLTEQALSLARAGASEEKRERVDLAEIARTLCGELQDMGVNARAEAEAPVVAECRPEEIARAMRNLAENAAKYAGEGVVRVYRSPTGEAVIDVLDDGPGLPDALLARVTEPFYRADEARSTHAEGAGLGLAIVQAIADGHGGRLELANRAPHGLSAKLILPG
ncbi:MAG TPA: ATP-binding protein [Caulobacterales bacterium]|nr:ATP-binding protein [Caulobacterales bacterium]